MRMLTFARRTAREILRDPVNLMFGIGFPLVLLLLLSAIQMNVPVPLFEIGTLLPGISVFGLSFFALFTAVLVSKDRSSSLLIRLYATPLTAADFLLGYTLPMLPIALCQSCVCCIAALCLGLPFSGKLAAFLGLNLVCALLFIALGLLFGSILNDKQAGGICGALLTNLTAWLSGAWFDLKLVGGVFETIANLLPFVHAVELERALLSGAAADIPYHLIWVLGYTVPIAICAVLLFLRQMRRA